MVKLDYLPVLAVRVVFEYLPFRDIKQLRLVNRRFVDIIVLITASKPTKPPNIQ